MPLACIPIEGCDFGPQNPGICTHPPGGLPHGPVPSGEMAFGSYLFSLSGERRTFLKTRLLMACIPVCLSWFLS